MEFSLDKGEATYYIHSYRDGIITVNNQTYDFPIVVMPRELLVPWGPDSFETLSAEHFELILEFSPQVVLVGTGKILRYPHPATFTALMTQNIGFEVMNTAAACRTYAVLMAEGRRVACALLC